MTRTAFALIPLAALVAACGPTYQDAQARCVAKVGAGALVGGVVGNQFGGGVGNTVATAVGASGGAILAATDPDCQPGGRYYNQPRVVLGADGRYYEVS